MSEYKRNSENPFNKSIIWAAAVLMNEGFFHPNSLYELRYCKQNFHGHL